MCRFLSVCPSVCDKNRLDNNSFLCIQLLDACVSNCGHSFHLEISSRDFVTECKSVISKGHPKVALKLKESLKKWAEGDFKSDPALK